MENTQLLMGFDFGLKSIGIAVGQIITKTASSLCAIKANKGEPDWKELQKIISEWHPGAFVVGVPVDMRGNDLSVTQQAKHFIEQLRAHFHLPVYAAEERLTTKEARDSLFKEKGFRGLSKANVDATSAKIILESWMNGENE